MAEKTRYSDAELEEFRAIIMEKLELAQRDYEQLKKSLMGLDGNARGRRLPAPSKPNSETSRPRSHNF